jgi:hypothetical protein
MRDVNSLVKIPELNRDMRQFSMELTKVVLNAYGESDLGGHNWRDDG